MISMKLHSHTSTMATDGCNGAFWIGVGDEHGTHEVTIFVGKEAIPKLEKLTAMMREYYAEQEKKK